MNEICPWPPCPPPMPCSLEVRQAYIDKHNRWKLSYDAWNLAMDKHNVWWRRLTRALTPGRKSFEILDVHHYWDAEFTYGQEFTT